jgi:uncharacterized membrane protein
MAEKQVDMAERQMSHRHDMERVMVRGHNFRAHLGLWFALLLAITVLGASVWLIRIGHDLAGTSIAAIDLVGLAGVFVYGRYDQSRREQQRGD